jgi:ribosome-associated protein|tara:strand:- start:28272 stop:28796 length:525 start_codon:yes stop_codon:yes gene_type:complete
MNKNKLSESHQKDELPEEAISKSALKREMTALQKIGEELVDLPSAKLAKIPMPEILEDAIMLARRLKNREGKRRQLQYIGKIMRTIDHEAIKERLNSFDQQSKSFRQQFHRLEQWRDQLIADGDQALDELLNESPKLDRQHLRQLIRQAHKETSQNKSPAASRKIFKYLQENIE